MERASQQWDVATGVMSLKAEHMTASDKPEMRQPT